MSKSSRYLAFLSYLLSLPGAFFVILARRDDAFANYHARQSLGLAAVAVVAPVIWGVVAWVLAWIPIVGGMLGVILFALLLVVYAGLLVDWIIGMNYALRGKVRRIPLTGPLSIRFQPVRPAAPPEISETNTELIERTSTSDA